MEVSVKQRLIEFIKYKGISIREFERRCGVSNGYIKALRKSPTTDKMMSIIRTFPEINQAWLITGNGEMITGSPQPDVDVIPVQPTSMEEYATTSSGNTFYQRSDGKLILKVPVVPISVLGSPPDEFEGEQINLDDYETELFEVDSVHHGKYFCFRVDGDSMDNGSRNSFERGDTVLVRELARDKWLPRLHYKQWPYWVIVFGNNIRLKQIIP